MLVGYWSLTFAALPATDWQTVVKPLRHQVPRIEIQDGENKGVCSGVILNAAAGYVLTAGHCVDGKPADLSVTVNGNHADIVKVNKLLDLAVLKIESDDEVTLPLAKEPAAVGSEIAVVGFMLGSKTLHVQFGRVAAIDTDEGALIVDGVVLPGDSGGALINGAGELVGMSNRYYRGTAIGMAVPVKVLRKFAKDFLPKP
jgi:S1-C subfamily serine protease